ncbi:MAG: hypothetical protein K1X72_23720 [Pyrinomonadaceae bacterium]|nr:hypothetical protein [Pyrinomonadaceae bacterium]
MTLDINEQEKEILLEILRSGHLSLLDELHHTENYDYKQMLKERDELLKNLRSRIEETASENI